MGFTVGVLQSNYIPWKGYFDIIHDVDLFVFYDGVQYTKNDWRNRNRVKSPRGTCWLTIPIGPRWHLPIREVQLPTGKAAGWSVEHWHRLESYYREAPFFEHYAPRLREFYRPQAFATLSELNHALITTIAHEFLDIRTRFADSSEFPHSGTRLERLLALVRATGATKYVSGPAAKTYIDPARFAEEGIELVWKDYAGYPEYPQLHPPFEHAVTILDLLFHVGPKAPNYIWGWREDRGGGGS